VISQIIVEGLHFISGGERETIFTDARHILIYGPSSAGKTTLLKAIQRAYDSREETGKVQVTVQHSPLAPDRIPGRPNSTTLLESRGPSQRIGHSLTEQRWAEVLDRCETSKYVRRMLFLDMPDLGLDDAECARMAKFLGTINVEQMFVTSSRPAFFNAWGSRVIHLAHYRQAAKSVV
jgi:GTPase SAR1 family protein